jgi:phosphoserine phosphatase
MEQTKMKLYLTRHGETEWNQLKKMQGRMDSPLTSKGIQQAKALSERLQDVPIQRIYSSPSRRAVHTAEIIRGKRPISIHKHEDLYEMHLGHWEGQTLSQLEKTDPDSYKRFWSDPAQYRPAEGETYQEIQQRVLRFLSYLKCNHPDDNILIVTHAVVLKVLLAHLEQREWKRLWDKPFIPGGSLTIVEVQGEQATIQLYADSLPPHN